MNIIDVVYLLRMELGYVNYIINKFNLKLIALPLVYLLLSLIIMPRNISNTYVYETSTLRLDAYSTSISKEDKVAYIKEHYNLTDYQFKVLSAIVLSEAEADSYEDAYAVINTIYNRTQAKNWVVSYGTSLYNQAIAPNQFVVYQNGTYLRNMNNTTSVGYDAIIDFLYTEDVMHNYLSFLSTNSCVKTYEKFSENGNKYFNELLEENRI